MGKTSFGFFDGFSGQVGNVIGYRWRGRMCVRSMPSHYNDARTPEQLQQRALFKYVVGFAAKARRVLKLGLHVVSLDAQMTESNYFMRINKRCFSVVSAAQPDSQVDTQVDYENLIFADGPVAPVAFDAPQMLDETTLQIDFEKNPLHRVARSEDLVYVVAYCPDLGDFDLSDPVYRRRNKLEFSFNEFWSGHEIHLWGFVVDPAGRASISQYIGRVILDYEVFTKTENGTNNIKYQEDNTNKEAPSEKNNQYHTTIGTNSRYDMFFSPPPNLKTK